MRKIATNSDDSDGVNDNDDDANGCVEVATVAVMVQWSKRYCRPLCVAGAVAAADA